MDELVGKHCIIIEGFPTSPAVTRDKEDRFRSLINKKITEAMRQSSGNNEYELEFSYAQTPLAADPVAVAAFIYFPRTANADKAVEVLNGIVLDKKGATLSAYRWEELENVKNIPETYEPPVLEEEGQSSATAKLNQVMEDGEGRPMFMMKLDHNDVGDTVTLLNWINYRVNSGKYIERYQGPETSRRDPISQWTEADRRRRSSRKKGTMQRSTPFWSPQGSYIITQHEDGLRVWGGKGNRTAILHIETTEVINCEVSPLENYIVVKTTSDVTLWSITKGKRVNSLTNSRIDTDVWPCIKFNADDSMCAVICNRLIKDEKSRKEEKYHSLILYNTATMTPITGLSDEAVEQKYTLESRDLLGFEWSPGVASQIALVYYEGSSTGYRCDICTIEVRTQADDLEETPLTADVNPLLRRNFVHAEPPLNIDDPRHKWNELDEDARNKLRQAYNTELRFGVLWHPKGAYLAAKFTLKGTVRNLRGQVEYALFRVYHNRATTEQLKIDGSALRFNWHPSGNYFAILLEAPNAVANAAGRKEKRLKIYDLSTDKPRLVDREILTYGTRLLWSPRTAHVRVACVDFSISYVNMFGIDARTKKIVEFGKREHNQVNNAQWDPTGRYLITWTGLEAEGGMGRNDNFRYIVGDMNNQVVFASEPLKQLHFISFRPLAPLALTKEELKNLSQTLPEFRKSLEDEQHRAEQAERQRVIDKREKEDRDYINLMNTIARDTADQTETRYELQQQSPALRRRQRAKPAAASVPNATD